MTTYHRTSYLGFRRNQILNQVQVAYLGGDPTKHRQGRKGWQENKLPLLGNGSLTSLGRSGKHFRTHASEYHCGRGRELKCLCINSHWSLGESCSWEELISCTPVLPCTRAQRVLVARGAWVIATKSQTEMQVLRGYKQVPDGIHYSIQRLNEGTSSGDQGEYVNLKDVGR